MNNQTSMKPETDYFHYTCPRCNDWVGYYGLKSDYNFCKKCGVKLSWFLHVFNPVDDDSQHD